MLHLPPSLSRGTIFANQFRVLERIEEGRYLSRYVAERVGSRETCLLDVLAAPVPPGAVFRDRFMREVLEAAEREGIGASARAVGRVLGAGTEPVDDAANAWLALERTEGMDLSALPALSPDEVHSVFSQVALALGAAHAAGRAHGGLRPETILVARAPNRGPDVRVVHFGVAAAMADARIALSPALPPFDPAWAAPEQLAGLEATPAVDVWTIGLLVFRALAGEPFWKSCGFGSADRTIPLPTVGAEWSNLFREAAREPIPPASQRAKNFECAERLPADFDTWFARCVVRNPEERFPTAEAAIAALAPMLLRASASMAAAAPRRPASVPPMAVPSQRGNGPVAVHSVRPPGLGPSGWLALGAVALGAILMLGVMGAFAVQGFRTYRQRAAAAALARASAQDAQAGVVESSANSGATSVTSAAGAAAAGGDGADTVVRVPVGKSPVRGPADALITIVEFGDFDCPFTKRVEPTLEQVRSTYGSKVRVAWKNEPLASHSRARAAADLAMDIRAQKGDDAFWAAHDHLLALTLLDDDALRSVAATADLSGRSHEASSEAAIADDEHLAVDARAAGTPVFFVNGKRLNGAQPFEAFRSLIDSELVKAQHLVDEGVPTRSVYDMILANDAPAVDLDALPKADGRGGAGGAANAGSGLVANGTSNAGADHAGAGAASPRLIARDAVVGTGASAKAGSVLTVLYVGKLEGGDAYDTKHRSSPFTFTLGRGQVTRGWEQGLLGMRAGGRRHLVVPPQLAYGQRGIPGAVPPNATLAFDVELVSLQ